MARLGAFEYPETTLSDALTIGRRVAREFMGSVSRSGLARSLDMSDRGGGFGARVGALRIWGVGEGRGTIRLTRDGMRAVNPLSPEEAADARRRLAAGVPIFVELARRLGGLPPDRSRLAILIEEITGANRIEVERRLPVFARIFEDALPLLTAEDDAAPGEALPAPARPPAGEQAGAPATFVDIPGLLDRGVGGDGGGGESRVEVAFPGGRISLPETVASLDVIIQVLQERRGRLARGDRGM